MADRRTEDSGPLGRTWRKWWSCSWCQVVELLRVPNITAELFVEVKKGWHGRGA